LEQRKEQAKRQIERIENRPRRERETERQNIERERQNAKARLKIVEDEVEAHAELRKG
jgi:hypothetical protein